VYGIVSVAFCGVAAHAGSVELVDDFSDGDVFDCDPLCWTSSADFPGVYDASSGDLVFEEGGALVLEGRFEGDVSVRTLIRFPESPDPDGGRLANVWIHSPRELNGVNSYLGGLSITGEVGVSLFAQGVPGVDGQNWEGPALSAFDPTVDYFIQLETRGDLMEFRAWRADEPMPEEAQIQVSDTTHRSGSVGIFNSMDGLIQRSFSVTGTLATPDSGFTLSVDAGDAPLEVCAAARAGFSGEGAQEVSYDWRFGEGETAQGLEVCHTYDAPGSYLVKLRATNDRGFVSETRQSVVVSCPAEDVGPWNLVTVGEVVVPAGARFAEGGAEGDLVLCGTGDLLDSSVTDDNLPFLAQEMSGDVVLSAQLADVQGLSGRGEAGVLIRESLEPGARYVAMMFRANSLANRLRFGYRDTADADTDSPDAAGREPPDLRLRVVKRGDEFVGEASVNGTTWQEIGRRRLEGFSDPFYAGLAAIGEEVDEARGGPGFFEALSAHFTNIEVSVPARFLRADCNQSGQVDISDGQCILDWRFGGAPAPGCLAATNTNGDGRTDIADAIYLFGALFLGGPPPAAPFPECGVGTESDEALGCGTPPENCKE
jgi:PKD repeat protein